MLDRATKWRHYLFIMLALVEPTVGTRREAALVNLRTWIGAALVGLDLGAAAERHNLASEESASGHVLWPRRFS